MAEGDTDRGRLRSGCCIRCTWPWSQGLSSWYKPAPLTLEMKIAEGPVSSIYPVAFSIPRWLDVLAGVRDVDRLHECWRSGFDER